MSPSNLDFSHEIQVCHEKTSAVLWKWYVKDLGSIDQISRRLSRLVREDLDSSAPRGITQVYTGHGITQNALSYIISLIPPDSNKKNGDPPVPTTRTELGFQDLLDLAIVCWEYECSIHESIRKFAKAVKTGWEEMHPEEWKKGVPRIQKSIDWMFLSTVFEWVDPFQDMSVRVIMRFTPTKRPAEDNIELPQNFRDLVDRTRREVLFKTYNFVRDNWISLYHPGQQLVPYMNAILAYFDDITFNIDLRDSATEHLQEKIDPYTLLEEFMTIVMKEEEAPTDPHPRMKQRPVSTDSFITTPNGKPMRGGGRGMGPDNFGSAVPSLISKGWGSIKPKGKNKTPNGSGSIATSDKSLESWNERKAKLEHSINNFRENLRWITYAGSTFSELRNSQIHRAVELHE